MCATPAASKSAPVPRKPAIKKIIGIEKAGITYVFDGKSRIMTANANVTTNSKTSIDTAAGKSFSLQNISFLTSICKKPKMPSAA